MDRPGTGFARHEARRVSDCGDVAPVPGRPTAAIACRAVQAQGLPNMNPCVSVVGCLPSAVSGSLVVRGVSAWSVRIVLVVQIPDSGGFWTKRRLVSSNLVSSPEFTVGDLVNTTPQAHRGV